MCTHILTCFHVFLPLPLYIAGVNTHSLDYRKSAGGFIHGYRYTGNHWSTRGLTIRIARSLYALLLYLLIYMSALVHGCRTGLSLSRLWLKYGLSSHKWSFVILMTLHARAPLCPRAASAIVDVHAQTLYYTQLIAVHLHRTALLDLRTPLGCSALSYSWKWLCSRCINLKHWLMQEFSSWQTWLVIILLLYTVILLLCNKVLHIVP